MIKANTIHYYKPSPLTITIDDKKVDLISPQEYGSINYLPNIHQMYDITKRAMKIYSPLIISEDITLGEELFTTKHNNWGKENIVYTISRAINLWGYTTGKGFTKISPIESLLHYEHLYSIIVEEEYTYLLLEKEYSKYKEDHTPFGNKKQKFFLKSLVE